jgi:hypothetical protein
LTQYVDSASDDRTVNNAVRHQYRVLTDLEKEEMQEITDLGAALIWKIVQLSDHAQPTGSGDVDFNEDRPLPDRNLELARQHAEDAVMRAVRHITG